MLGSWSLGSRDSKLNWVKKNSQRNKSIDNMRRDAKIALHVNSYDCNLSIISQDTDSDAIYTQTRSPPQTSLVYYPSSDLLFPSLFLGGGITVLTAGYSLLGVSSFNLSHCTSQTTINLHSQQQWRQDRWHGKRTRNRDKGSDKDNRNHTRLIRVHIILQMLE